MNKEKLITALKTQCVLSFIMCGVWILLCPIVALTFSDLNPEFIKQINAESPEQAEMLLAIKPYLVPLFLSVLVLNIVSLIGVWLMYRLQAIGLYIYIFAELSTYVIGLIFKPEYVPNQEASAMGGLMQTLILIGIDSIFIFQYRGFLKAIERTETIS